ncbi:AAA family ATPase [Providencia rettgeri]|uniref:AAA family ATPase n=1 Tax=Providencia rettgeri TaxID=587 RepID=UPI001F03FB1F|nr:AAA family ATPase [Providencia rettgeri]MCG9951814.1 AAA family ATPase [Providencia rettgeri]
MKVCIIGISGAGKTTLAKKLAIELNVPTYAYDDIYWNKRSGEYIKNTPEIINSLVSAIKSERDWIVEGAYDRRMLPLFEDCSLIIRLKIPYRICVLRIIKRYLLAKITKTRHKETILNTIELLRFAKRFDNQLNVFFDSNPAVMHKIVEVNNTKQCSLEIKKHLNETS